VYDPTCVAYAIIVDKTDGDAFNNKMGIWANIRFSL
jgi:hypothetical protein